MLRTLRLKHLLLAGLLILGLGLLVSHRHLVRILRATPRLSLFPEDATPLPGPSPEIAVPPHIIVTIQPFPTASPALLATALATDMPEPPPNRAMLPFILHDGPDRLYVPFVAADNVVVLQATPTAEPPTPTAEPPTPRAATCSDGNYSCVRDVIATGCERGNFACLREAAPWLPAEYNPWSSGTPAKPHVVITPPPTPTATPTPNVSRIFDQSLAELNPSLPADLSLAVSPPGYDIYVNSYDYFLSKHTDTALGGIHSLNQIVDGERSLYMKGWPDRFELHTLGDFIRLKEDHSGAPNPPYTFSDGRWMPREWKPGDTLTVRAEENTIQFYSEDCQPTFAAAFGYTMRFVALLPNVNLGGVLGVRSKILVLEYRYYTDREIFLYDSEEGWVAWQLYKHDQLTQEVRFNRPRSVPILPNPQSICVLR